MPPLKPLSIEQILEWADRHEARTGRWPTSRTGPIIDCPDRTWEAVQTALRKGICGLPGGSSLWRLLRKRRKIRDPRVLAPELTLKNVIEWTDWHHARTGRWPNRNDGRVPECPAITWSTIHMRMKAGKLGQPRGMTLARWLRDARGVWDGGKPRLTEKLVLRWANEHYAKFGRWPVTLSGRLFNHPKEDWAAIDVGMRNKRRGFPEKISLSQLLRRHLGDRYRQHIGQPKGVVRKAKAPRFVTVQRKPASS